MASTASQLAALGDPRTPSIAGFVCAVMGHFKASRAELVNEHSTKPRTRCFARNAGEWPWKGRRSDVPVVGAAGLWRTVHLYWPLAAAGSRCSAIWWPACRAPTPCTGGIGGPGRRFVMLVMPYRPYGLAAMVTAFVWSVFYSLEALYGERGIAVSFLEIVAVSDFTTVLSKASIPLVFCR